MMNSIETSSTPGLVNQTASNKIEVMGKDDFLNLLVTQLKYQDPLNPLDSTDFTAQLAQFSSLEQLANINAGLDNLINFQTGMNNTQALSFIGKTVQAYGSSIHLKDGTANPLTFELESKAEKVFINIYDSYQNLVTTIQSGEMEAGSNSYAWNGTDKNGNSVPDGSYSFDVFAYSGDQIINSVPYIETMISGVSYQGKEAYLNAGDLIISKDSVFKVKHN
jgi:flagellar basal-body rod modification protein FlgD